MPARVGITIAFNEYSTRRETIVLKQKGALLMAHQDSFSRDAGPLGLLLGERRMSRRSILRKLAGLTLAGGSITSFVPPWGYPTNTYLPSQSATSSSLGTPHYTYRGHSASVNAVAWSTDGKRIVSGSNDGTVQVWDAANGGNVFIYRGHTDHVNAVPWSPDGKRIASGSDDHTVQVWDAANGRHVFTYRGHTDAVWGVAWSPDGKQIVSGSGNIDNGRGDTTAQGWDAAHGGNAFIYRGHSGPVWTAAWS